MVTFYSSVLFDTLKSQYVNPGRDVVSPVAILKLTVSSAQVALNLQFSTVLIILVLLLSQACHSITLCWKTPI